MLSDKVKDQVQGLVFGLVVAALITVATNVVTAGDAELTTAAWWFSLVPVVGRSIATAVLGALGVTVKGVSDGS